MKDIFPQVRALILADSYFATTLAGFKNEDGEAKLYPEMDAPDSQWPFGNIDVRPGRKGRNNDWTTPDVIVSFTGPNEESEEHSYLGKVTLYKLCQEVERILRANNCLPAAAGNAVVGYEAIGDSLWDQGENPILEMVTVSVSVRLGIVSP